MAVALSGCDAQSPPSRAAGSSTGPASGLGTSTTRPQRTSERGQPLNGSTFLVWVPGGAPKGTEEALQKVNGVTRTTTVTGGLTWIDDASDGRRPPPGYRYPFEIAYVRPSAYAALIEGARIPEVERLGPGQWLLAETAAGLRESGAGLRLTVDGHRTIVRDVVPDAVTSGYEALAAGPAPAGWGDEYVLVRSESQPPLERAMERFLGPGKRFRVVGAGSTPFLRYADRVSPQMYYKQRFGEFAARPGSAGSLQVERGWVRKNIVHARLPLIGRVTCHRKYVAELRSGLRAVLRAGLARGIKPEEYAGCYNARHIGWDPTERLSSHAWGAAVDINAASNPLGSAPSIDRRIVRLLERAGLNWGGDWLVPDGMHFEWKAPTGPP